MNATIVNFRRGKHRQTCNQAIIKVEKVDDIDAAKKLVGKSVKYVCEGKSKTEIVGKVASSHGNSGAIRVLFEKGLPGQAIGNKAVVQ